jgi:hypothetical protein
MRRSLGSSNITDQRLADVYEEDRLDAETVGDVPARVRASFAKAAAREVSEAKQAASPRSTAEGKAYSGGGGSEVEEDKR